MLSRTQPIQIQLSASRCLTYLERAGAISSTDKKIVFKTIPCLARLCTPQFEEEVRANAAENLAYLTEVCSFSFFIVNNLYQKYKKSFKDRYRTPKIGRHK